MNDPKTHMTCKVCKEHSVPLHPKINERMDADAIKQQVHCTTCGSIYAYKLAWGVHQNQKKDWFDALLFGVLSFGAYLVLNLTLWLISKITGKVFAPVQIIKPIYRRLMVLLAMISTMRN